MTDNARATAAPPIDTRLKIAALWTSLLFIFAYVDIFAFFRADILQGALAGKVAVFTVDQSFLLLTTIYVIIPSLMISLSLILPPRANRLSNIIVAAVYALTILGSCIGEVWIYYWLGSLTEVLLLLVIIRYAWKMP
ncbi:DUF6326 family protein [Profundibacter sp.]|uniref:DUF6326 family protein n=1 Tax=Profundibacter sp. TaxID=3101071 RepID=UPI003D0D0BC9